ncbi:phage replisome organizer N-terminal domain-containing protein [Leuconostoc pseudomesenteroides]|uniref:phage replisome organizer N-terminal domain-containing protein n=1 Tax=Leuconostoc pseudomesenteroides TaxID=33968 RepID=UPI00345ECCE5
MADRKKRYYWLKLKEDFFDEDTMKYIEELPNGKEYSLIYLKMCLKSLKLDGYLKRVVGNTVIPYDIPTLSKLVNSNVDTVRVAMKIFEEIGLVSVLDGGEIYMSQLSEMIGSETEAAKQKRIERANSDFATLSHDSRKNVAQSIEKELEIEKEIDTETEPTAYQEIVAVYEKNGFGLVSPIVSEKINDELKDFASESNEDEAVSIITKAMEIAALNSANNFNYVLAITKKWYNKKLFTLKAVEADELKNKSASRYGGRRNIVEPQLASVSEPVEEPERELPEWLTDAAKDL